jgi:two-component system chemotaxis response regulator CheB
VRSVIVFGGSAGGLQALSTILKALPDKLAAAVMAVIHTSQKSMYLPEVLGRCSGLKMTNTDQAAPIESGRLYIPSPNRHLVVKSRCAVSLMGPRENRHRPAIDALFRSAARAYRSRVIAVVLSGALDDGCSGALAVKARGGTVIVQDPADAQVEEMPVNVLRQVKTDYCLPLAEIPAMLKKLVAASPAMKLRKVSRQDCIAAESDLNGDEKEPPGISCPECGGALLRVKDGETVQFRCHVGHNFSMESFSEAHADAVERALWVALRRLNEQRAIQRSLSETSNANPELKKRYLENAAAAEHDMRLLHEVLGHL